MYSGKKGSETAFNIYPPQTKPLGQIVDEAENRITKQKLQLEINQLRQREQLYEAKRKELIELELQYRKNQGFQVKKRDGG